MSFIFLVVVFATIAFNLWASLPYFGYPLNDMSQAAVSALYPNLVTPATYAFSIWLLIYVSWVVVAIVMFLRMTTPSSKFMVSFMLAVGLSGIWLLPFHYLYEWLSLGIMFLILIAAFVAMRAARSENVIIQMTSELLFGWITVATLANIAVVVVATPSFASIGVFSPVVWTLIGLGIGTLIHVWLMARYRVFIPAIVYIWALIANIVEHTETIQRAGVAVFTVALLAMAVSTARTPLANKVRHRI